MSSSSGGLSTTAVLPLLDRELSWMAFNRRTFYAAIAPQQPVLERLLRLAQTSATLDEYFMVRVPRLKAGISADADEADGADQQAFDSIQTALRSLVVRQQGYFTYSLRPDLARQGIHLLNYRSLTEFQRRQVHRRFEDEVLPVLTPLLTPPTAPMPDFSNLSLNLAITLQVDAAPQLAWIKVPRSLWRFVVLQPADQATSWLAVPLEQVIAAHLPMLFPETPVTGAFAFRVTRSADLGTLDAETANLMDMILDSLQQRQQQGQAVRLEVVRDMPTWVRSQLMAHLALRSTDLYRLRGWLGLSDLKELTTLPRPDLSAPPWQPVVPAALVITPKPSIVSFSASPPVKADLFQVLQTQDLLVHLPYHSFAATVEAFVAQAATDDTVLTIKMTLYRTAGDAPIVRSLIAAAKAGKQVVVLVELTAPLDEAINIQWARSLEKAGAHVVYGVVGLKTHTNLVLIVRREAGQLQQYAYVGTGDYLPSRPQPYEDLGFLTSRLAITQDLNHLFNFLTGCSRQVRYRTLMVAPATLRDQLQQLIAREAGHAQRGRPARLIVKLNLLADPDMIAALYGASQAGVEIDLIVRGVCRLCPGIPGVSDRIRVISILGRYVEHSRILYCENGGTPEAWLGTADWTPRGLHERIEVMAPLQAPELIAEIRQRLEIWLADTQDAWQLQPEGNYIRRCPAAAQAAFSAQDWFMEHARQTGIIPHADFFTP